MKYTSDEPGYQFINFKKELKDVKKVGYITDKDISPEKNDGFFLQAQYFLAPTIIQVGQSNNNFNILDSLNIRFMLETIRKTHSKRITNNKYGQALFKRIKQ